MFDAPAPSTNSWSLKDKKLSPLLKQALDDPHRQEHGLAVVFVTKDKYPKFKNWQMHAKEGQKATDIKQLYEKRKDFTAYSYYTGIGGLLDIDFDWSWLYDEAVKFFGDRFNTRTLRTPNGGYRVLFRTEEPDDFLKYKEIPPHIEIHGKPTHHVVVHGKVLTEKGTMGEYEVVKDLPIRKDPTIIPDFIKFMNDVMEKCNFLHYPCIRANLKKKQVELTQEQRTSIGAFFIAEKIDMDLATDFFRCTDDFDYPTTRNHLELLKKKNFKHPKCEKLRENFHWKKNKCSGCTRNKNQSDNGQSETNGVQDSGEKTNLATDIVKTVKQKAELLMDDRGVPCARFKDDSHYEIWPIGSKRFTAMLYRIGMACNANKVPNSDAVSNAQKYLEALAFQKDEVKLHNRVAEFKNAFWYDLSNKEWQAVKITKDNWEIIDHPPALFRREQHQKPQVHPNIDTENLWSFFEHVNVPEDKKLLLLVYLIACFIPNIPHPVIIIYGPPGSGKSMLMEFLRDILDPSKAPKLKIPKGDKDLVQNFDHHYAPFFDNLDTIQPWLSDIICRAVTGEGSEYRALYTNDDSVIRNYRRCVGLTGINVPARKGDLLDRGILIGLDQLPEEERQDEAELMETFHSQLPEILGGIFTTICKAMAMYPLVKLEKLPRMADFAKWGYAIAEALDGKGKEFLRAYSHDEENRIMEALDANPLSTAIIALIGEIGNWEGSPTELLKDLENIVETEKIDIRKSKIWPKSPPWLTRRLNEIESALFTAGIEVEQQRDGQKRTITLHKVHQNEEDSVITDTAVSDSDDDGSDGTDSKIHRLEDFNDV